MFNKLKIVCSTVLKKIIPKAQEINSSELESKNNTWFSYSDESDTVIIFVHGFITDSMKCWNLKDDVNWPYIVANDSNFDKVSIFLGGYFTAASSGDFDIRQCTLQLERAISLSINNQRAPISFKNIIFLAHSLGGIVTRHLIELNSNKFTTKSIGLILMASPTMGSSYADLFKFIGKFYGNKVSQQLRINSETLKDIDNRFRDLIHKKNISKLIGAEAIEQNSPVYVNGLPSFSSRIVAAESASRYFGGTVHIPNSNHFDIVKPNSIAHESHRFLINFFVSEFSKVRQVEFASNHTNQIPEMALSNKVLFDVYNKQSDDYFLSRADDQNFIQILTMSSIWLCGESGVGKTTIVKRLLSIKSFKPIEMTLSHIGSELSDERLQDELIQTVNTVEQSRRSNTFAEAVDALTLVSQKTPIVLFIDEVPLFELSDISRMRLLKFLSSLLDAIKKNAGSTIQFVICSIDEPNLKEGGEKLVDQIRLLKLQRWTNAELLRLTNTIETALPSITVSFNFKIKLINAVQGSPRILKNFYKRRLAVNILDESESISLACTLADFNVEEVTI